MRFNLKQEVFLIMFTSVLNICYKGFQLLYIHLFLFYKLTDYARVGVVEVFFDK